MANEMKPEEINQTKVAVINTPTIYESLRYNDYSVENGLGEIVDNSVEAGASEIRVKFIRTKKKVGKREIEEIDRIEVVDNGCGMDLATIAKCLVLGCSMRERKNAKLGIGKFGVGMTLGGISLARRIEVYSRDEVTGEFYYVYLDLDEIKDGKTTIDIPIKKEVPEEYREFFKENTGTLVILSECDRMDGTGKRVDANELDGLVTNYLGRTYRKFIEGSVNIYLNDRKVYLHDPLYMAGPTQFDTKEKQDPKAKLYSETSFDWEIPGGNGETATINIKLSLLPLEWRTTIGDGGNIEARRRKIDQNEGVSILRANREVLYDKIPYLIGLKRGQFSYQDNDRWWGCEILFPPELDECFQVRYIKRGAEPIGALKDRLKSELTGAVTSLRKIIKEDRAQVRAEKSKKNREFEDVEKIMADVNDIFPMNQAGRDLTPEEEDEKIEAILDETVPEESETEAERNIRKETIQNRLYTIETVKQQANVLFVTDMLLDDKMVIKLNVNHPFYQKVIEPLCGDALKDDSAEDSVEKKRTRDAIMLLLMSFAKAKAGIRETQANSFLLNQLESQWGVILSAVSSKLES